MLVVKQILLWLPSPSAKSDAKVVTHSAQRDLGLKRVELTLVKRRMMANCLTWLSGFSHTSH